MVLTRASASKSSAIQSCGSICVVHGLKASPSGPSTTPRANASQSMSG